MSYRKINGLLDDYFESHRFVTDNRDYWNRAQQAIRSKISENERAEEALAVDEAAGREERLTAR